MVKFVFRVTTENGTVIPDVVVYAKDKLDAFAIIKHRYPFAKKVEKL